MTEAVEWKDTEEFRPSKPGWYAVLKCWDVAEGFCCDAFQWDGKEWNPDDYYPITHFIDKPFDAENQAIDYAYENDPNW